MKGDVVWCGTTQPITINGELGGKGYFGVLCVILLCLYITKMMGVHDSMPCRTTDFPLYMFGGLAFLKCSMNGFTEELGLASEGGLNFLSFLAKSNGSLLTFAIS